MEYAKANKRSWLRDEQMLAHLKEFFHTERQLADVTPPNIEGYKLHRRKQVSGATASRSLNHRNSTAAAWYENDAVLIESSARWVKGALGHAIPQVQTTRPGLWQTGGKLEKRR